VRIFVAAGLLAFGAAALRGQEAELPPIVVTGTFELRQGPSITDLFTQYLTRQMEAKRAADEMMARSPLYYARFWSYIPMRLESSSTDSSPFLTPSYLTPDYRNAERALEDSRKHSLFDGR
jgi:hypothetical protein